VLHLIYHIPQLEADLAGRVLNRGRYLSSPAKVASFKRTLAGSSPGGSRWVHQTSLASFSYSELEISEPSSFPQTHLNQCCRNFVLRDVQYASTDEDENGGDKFECGGS